jgi:glycosyltransferase involved in cell wall biosynthesis
MVLRIARRLPEVDFLLWGETVLGGDRLSRDLPANVEVQGRYDHITDLDLTDADLWLYTSAWDGVPSQLLEVGMTGVPIVATLVGGTGEVLTPADAWLVPEDEDAAAYESAIREVLADPDEATKRGRALRERLMRERTEDDFAEHVASVLLLHRPKEENV